MSKGPSFGITSFHIEGFRGIKNTSVEGIPADTKWIFLTGKNGGGKTSVLQALFVGLFGNRDGKQFLEEDTFDISIAIEYQKETFKRRTKGLGDGLFETNNMLGLRYPGIFGNLFKNQVLAYGVSRLNMSNDSNGKSSKSYSLFNSDGMLFDVESALKNWAYRSDSLDQIDEPLSKSLASHSKKLQEILLRLMPNLFRVEIDAKKDQILYYEKDDQGSSLNEPKTFLQLASGNRSLIAMIGDMVIRLLENQPEILNLSELAGIIIIDELDTHLHPTWQKALPDLLSEIFPKIQFIASTHSPIPLLGAPKESVVLKVHQSSEEGITVEKLDIDLTRLLPNSLLTSPIFDFDEIIPIANTSLSDLHTEDSFQEAMANEEIKNRLKKIAQSLK